MHKKTKILIAIFVCMLTAILSITPALADEEPYEPWRAYGYDHVGGDFNRTLAGWAWDIFGNGMVDTATQLLQVDIKKNIGSASNPFTLEDIYKNVIGAIEGIGLALMCLYALLDTLEKVQNENFTIDHMIKLFIKLIVGFILLTNIEAFVNGALELSNSLMITVKNSFGSGGTAGLDKFTFWFNKVKGGGWLSQLGNMFALLVPWILSYLSLIVVFFISFGRLLEFFVRASLAPIGMANIIGRGLEGPGWRYFKKLLAVGLQGVVIITILIVSAYLKNGMDNIDGLSTLGDFIGILIINFVCVAAVIKSQSWANDLVGV